MYETKAMREGSVAFDSRDGASLSVYLRNMSPRDAFCIKCGPIQTAHIVEPPYWLGLLKIDNNVYRIVFDPMKHVDGGNEFLMRSSGKDCDVCIHGIAHADRIPVIRRFTRYPSKLLESLRFGLSDFIPTAGYAEGYQKFIAKWVRIPQETLWNVADKAGEIGRAHV